MEQESILRILFALSIFFLKFFKININVLGSNISEQPTQFGVSNKLNEELISGVPARLSHIVALERSEITQTICEGIASVNPQTINEEEIEKFLVSRIHNIELKNTLKHIILAHKTNWKMAYQEMTTLCQSIHFPLVTDNRELFEDGYCGILLASEQERTGYSHEPVGIIIDTSCNNIACSQLSKFAEKLSSATVAPADMTDLLTQLAAQTEASLSFDEKNQAGGRALRTPHGQVRYIEFTSNLLNILNQIDAKPILQALRVEASFADIFTHDEALSLARKTSIQINQKLITQITSPLYIGAPLEQHIQVIKIQWAQDLQNPTFQEQLSQHLATLWFIKTKDAEKTCVLLNTGHHSEFEELRTSILEQFQQNIAQPMISEFIEAYAIFSIHLQHLLRQQGSRYQMVKAAATQLQQNITRAQQQFLNENMGQTQFIQNVLNALETAAATFSQHPNCWDQCYPWFRALIGLLLCATALVILLQPRLENRNRTIHNTFFGPPPPTDAQQALEEFREQMQQAIPIALS